MKKTLSLVVASLLTFSAIAQIPLTLKPNASVGQDAHLWMLDNNVVPSGYAATPATLNFGDSPESDIMRWTWQGDPGRARTVIRFTGLNSLPAGAVIMSATLIMRTPTPTLSWGNSYFSGSPYPLTNYGWVKRVQPGAANNWNESTVTWNNQPATDPVSANWVPLPLTTSRWGYTVSANVTGMVQQIVSGLATDPTANNGFMLSLQDESTYYRAQLFASSDHPDAASWPELRIVYDLCKPSFSYCSSTLNPYIYTFTANNPQSAYGWTINGTLAGTAATMDANIAATSNICLNAVSPTGISKCTKCLSICPGDNPIQTTPCNGDFRFCSSTDNPYSYTFTAQAGQTYAWSLNGVPIGNSQSITYNFPTTAGYYPLLCLKATTANGVECTRCLTVCLPYNTFPLVANTAAAPAPYGAGSNFILPGDEQGLTTHALIIPNPSSTGWNIKLDVADKKTATLTVYDITGRLLSSRKEALDKGINTMYQDAAAFPAGIYYLEVKGQGISVKEKAVKVQ